MWQNFSQGRDVFILELLVSFTNGTQSNVVITVLANVLSPDGARPSAGIVLAEKLDLVTFKGFFSSFYKSVTHKLGGEFVWMAVEITGHRAALRVLNITMAS